MRRKRKSWTSKDETCLEEKDETFETGPASFQWPEGSAWTSRTGNEALLWLRCWSHDLQGWVALLEAHLTLVLPENLTAAENGDSQNGIVPALIPC